MKPSILSRSRRRIGVVVGIVAATVAATLPFIAAPSASAAVTLLSQGRPAAASSVENAGTPASAAVDGNLTGTRWSSQFSDPQWLRVDLGETASITQVVLRWEAAFARAFQIQVGPGADGPWTTVFATTTGTGGVQTLDVTGSGRYVRMLGTARATAFGYSLWEMQVYGEIGAPAVCGTANAALNQPAAASSVENAANPASAAVDGNATGTRWSSQFSDPQWLRVDLGSTRSVCRVVLRWEAAFARAFQIQVGPGADGPWTTVFATTTGTGGVQTLDVTGSGRYVRMLGTARATVYGYSLWEFEIGVLGGPTTPTPSPTPTPTGQPVEPTDPRNPNFGPNTVIFDPSTPTATMQSRLNAMFTEMERNQFGPQRYGILFKPGTYTADVNLGFYMHAMGLGLSPDDVNLNGHVRVEAFWFGGNATQNFWRGAENLSVTLPAGVTVERFAVSQAAPYRRMHLRGTPNQIQLWNGGDGWSSGGLMADTRIDGLVVSGSQQQWFSRNSDFGRGWTGSVWNMVFTGVNGAPPPNFPNPSHTVIDTAPVIREKPFMYIDGAGEYRVFVPGLRTNARGTSWFNRTPEGSSISLRDFFIVRPGTPASTINNALAQGKHLIVTPGVHHLNQTLRVTRPDTVVLGFGLATLVPDNGIVAMTVADVPGVKVAGLLFDAGPVNSPVLLEVGPTGANANNAGNPISLHDVYFRVGGPGVGRATTSLVVNSHHVIGDHMWLWRADHGDGVGWTVNTADTGLIVNGDNVVMYGLFVEHYQRYQTIWNGNGGRTYFYQNEMPYEPPNQAAWMNGTTRGYAAYKVADHVTTHQAWGLGSYCVFTADQSIVGERAFEVPNRPGVRFTNMVIVSLGGQGTINRVINNVGGPANSTTMTVYLTNYP